MKNIHYLFYIISKIHFCCHLQCLINLYILENKNFVLIAKEQIKGHRGALLIAALYHCTVLLNADIMVVHEWSLQWMPPCSPNPPTLLYTKQIDQEGISIMADLFVLIEPIFCIMIKTSFLEKMIVCLVVFNKAFKHLRSYGDQPTCSSGTLTNMLRK